MKGKAAITEGKGSFTIEEIQTGLPGEDEVLVQLKASGVCHTDYDSMRWGRSLILGHEGAGVVLQTGRNVNTVAAGDHVLLNWAMPCGTGNSPWSSVGIMTNCPCHIAKMNG